MSGGTYARCRTEKLTSCIGLCAMLKRRSCSVANKFNRLAWLLICQRSLVRVKSMESNNFRFCRWLNAVSNKDRADNLRAPCIPIVCLGDEPGVRCWQRLEAELRALLRMQRW